MAAVHVFASPSTAFLAVAPGIAASPTSAQVGRGLPPFPLTRLPASLRRLPGTGVQWHRVPGRRRTKAAADGAPASEAAVDTKESDASSTRALAAMAIGGVAGLLGGSLGLGGGFLVVPALTSLLNVPPRTAIGTSACVVLAVSCVGCNAYLQRGLASTRAALLLAGPALITARLGAVLTNKVNPRTLKKMFGGWLLIVSSLIGGKAAGLMNSASVAGAGDLVAAAPLLGLGALMGLISGLLGVGGGTVMVPSLTLGFHFPQPEAQGCALLGMVPPSMVSVWTHSQRNNVDRNLATGAVLGALFGGWSGSVLATRLPERALRAVFAVVLSLVGVKYLRT